MQAVSQSHAFSIFTFLFLRNSLFRSHWETEIRFGDLARKEKYAPNLVEAFLKQSPRITGPNKGQAALGDPNLSEQ